MTYGYAGEFENVQHIVTETYDQYANRRRWEAEQHRKVELFNLKLLIGGMVVFFVIMAAMFSGA